MIHATIHPKKTRRATNPPQNRTRVHTPPEAYY